MIAERTHHLDMDVCQCDWMVERIRRDDAYAQNFYAALCDRSWREDDAWEILSDRTWRVSWRTAGAIVSDIRGSGDYQDWYCTGSFVWHDRDGYEPTPSELYYVPEGMITEEIRQDLAQIGWYPVVDQ
jgi:hypothetical protein